VDTFSQIKTISKAQNDLLQAAISPTVLQSVDVSASQMWIAIFTSAFAGNIKKAVGKTFEVETVDGGKFSGKMLEILVDAIKYIQTDDVSEKAKLKLLRAFQTAALKYLKN